MKYLVLGNGAAGIMAAEKLRELNEKADLTVASSEEVPVYSKCMLPDYVGGKLSRERLFIRSREFYDNKRINLLLGYKVQYVDNQSKKVHFLNGEVKEYDKLLIAVGAVPFIPPVEGLEGSGYYKINSYSQAETIISNAIPGGKAVIMGAGLTGMEMAFALKRLGMEPVIVEREKIVLPRQLDPHSSSVLVSNIEKEGIAFLLGQTVDRVTEHGGRKYVELSNGESIDYDMLIVAIGTRSNVEIVKESSIKLNRGIIVDEFMQSSDEDVYAAGDVAETMSKQSNEYVSSYIWPNAMAQGQCAAYNMSGVKKEFESAASGVSLVQMRDIPFVSMGLVNPQGFGYETMVDYDVDGGIYKKLVLRNNTLKGMILIGDTSSNVVLSGFIRKGTDISEFKDILMDKDFAAKYKAMAK